MRTEPPTPQEIDQLLQFLPLLEMPGRSYVRAASGDETTLEQASSVPYPEYCEDVLAFFWQAGQPCWSDFEYEPREAWALLGDDRHIDTCSLNELGTLLTACVRSERFSDGAWLSLLESGRIVAILKRLAVLRDAL
jgi:hypothetical protein